MWWVKGPTGQKERKKLNSLGFSHIANSMRKDQFFLNVCKRPSTWSAHMAGISSKLLGRRPLINQIRQVNPQFLSFLIKLVFNNLISACWRFSKVLSGESLHRKQPPKEEGRQNANEGEHSSKRAWEYLVVFLWLSLVNITLIITESFS